MLAIGGISPGTGFGQLQVTGPVAVDGKLQLEFLDGFVPELGTSFPLVTADSRRGTYSTFLYPEGSVAMELPNMLDAVVAWVIEPLVKASPAAFYGKSP